MPRGDGTGPAGMGPMTGRAAGYCAGFAAPGYANSASRLGLASRRGRGAGRSRGLTRTARMQIPVRPVAPQGGPQQGPVQQRENLSRDQRIQALENQLAALEEQLGRLKDEISRL